MAEISHSASGPICSLPFVASMNEIIHSAPWRPWQKSAIVPAVPLQKDWNSSPFQIGTPVYCMIFSILYFVSMRLTIFKLLADV